jgi:2'-5' RNA ligase
MCSVGTEPAQRLFFALWPDAAVQAGLAALSRQLLGKRIRQLPADRLHVTLAFAGPVSAALRLCLEEAAAAVTAGPFEMTIDRVGHWSRPRILWAGPSRTPPELWQLVSDLHAVFEACGLQPERRPYQAHVTLARKISRAPPATDFEPLRWSIGDFCLVESVTDAAGAQYRVLRRWMLGGG